MVEEILPNLFRIEIPLPKNPLKTLNSYLIKGQDRFLIIDTGMNREECIEVMFSSLEKLDVDLKRTDFFITHMHADHIGMVAKLATDSSKIYFNWKEASEFDWFFSEERWKKVFALNCSHGFPEDELKKSIESHPGRRYGPKRQLDFCTLKDGDTVEMGDYSFKCVETPGHTLCHTCLYEPDKKILVSGDHILLDITPNIAYWPELKNSLQQYLASLEKVYHLDVNLLLPGHRNIGNNHKKRIVELQQHHQARLSEVLSAVKQGEKTAYEVAPYVTWDVSYKSWDDFPYQQKLFAVGETLAHLKYLEDAGQVASKTSGDKILFTLG